MIHRFHIRADAGLKLGNTVWYMLTDDKEAYNLFISRHMAHSIVIGTKFLKDLIDEHEVINNNDMTAILDSEAEHDYRRYVFSLPTVNDTTELRVVYSFILKRLGITADQMLPVTVDDVLAKYPHKSDKQVG